MRRGKLRSVSGKLLLSVVFLLGSSVPSWGATLDFRFQALTGDQTGEIDGITGTESTGGSAVGTDVVINELFVSGAGVPADGTYLVDGLLNFDTDTNNIVLVGTIPDLGINTDIELLSGDFTSFTANFDSDAIFSFVGAGSDKKHDDLLDSLGLGGSAFEFMTVELGPGSQPTTAGIINTTVVPTPTSFILFGTGMVGLIGMARRGGLIKLVK